MAELDVIVAICTYRRPEQLALLLQHLQRLELPPAHRGVEVLVVDNSPDGEAAPVARASTGPLPVHYVAHGARNIASGRNATLREAAPRARCVALIDDDEVPDVAWLAQLLAAQAETGADVVTGPVLARYPEGTPSWLQRHEFFSVVGPHDGAFVDEAVSGNALVRSDLVRRLSLRFDESLGTSGGEDQLFFRAARAGGGTLWFTPHAVVHEQVPQERLSGRYLLRREYRKGNTLGLLDRSRPGWPTGRPGRRLAASAWWTMTGVQRALVGALRQDRGAVVSGAMRAVRGAGMLSGLLGRTFALYGQTGPAGVVVAIVVDEDPDYQAAGHSQFLRGFVDHYAEVADRVVLVLTTPRVGFLARRRSSTSYRSPALRDLLGWQVVVAPRVLLSALAWRAFRTAPRPAQRLADRVRTSVRHRRSVDHRLGTWLSPAQQAQVQWSLGVEAPDVVLFSGLFTVPQPPVLPDSVKAAVLISHDVVSSRAQQFRQRGYRVDPPDFSEAHERAALEAVSTVVAIQWDEAVELQRLAPHADVVVVPVAMRPSTSGRADVQDGRCLFVGSGSLPNVEGLRWFLEHCWDAVRAQVPDAELHVVGTVCARLGSTPAGVVLRGEVEDLELEYAQAAVALVPLRTGSGLKVKIVEALCAGVAVVSSPVGAQGLGGLSPRPYSLADTPGDFIASVVDVLRSPARRRALEHAAAAAAQAFSPERAFAELDDVLRRRGVHLPPA